MGVKIQKPWKSRFINSLKGVNIYYAPKCVSPLTPYEIEYLEGGIDYEEERNHPWISLYVMNDMIEAEKYLHSQTRKVYDRMQRKNGDLELLGFKVSSLRIRDMMLALGLPGESDFGKF